MITSEQISALIAAQQQQAYSMQNPQMMGMPGPVPGPSAYPPQFSFGMGGRGPGAPAMGAHMAMAGIGAVPPALSGIGVGAGNIQGAAAIAGWAGIGAGTRLANNAFLSGASRLDPTSSMFMGAFAGGEAAWGGGAAAVARGAVGGAFGMGGLMNPITLGAGAVSFGIGQMHQGYVNQQSVNSQLGGFQFMNGQAQNGRGFSSANMMQVGNVMRSMDQSDAFTSMRDMTGMLGKFNEMGMGQTTRDADEFSRKFKAMADTVRTLAKTMGTTIDEAGRTFGALRQAGIYTARDVLGAGTQIKTLGTMGMGQDQALGIMQGGAGISRSMDMRGGAGSKAAAGLTESLLTGAQIGSFSGQQLMDATGQSDITSAAGAMSLSMTSKLASFLTDSAVGQATLATVGAKDAQGRFTGEVDQGQLSGIMSGKTGVGDLSATGRGRLAGKAAGLSFKNKNRDIAAGVLEEDPMAVTSILMNSIRDRHQDLDEEGLFTYTMEHMVGLDRRETEVAAKMFKDYEKTRRERSRKRMQEVQQSVSELDVKQFHTIEGWKQLVTGSISDALTPMQAAGAQMGTDLERTGQRMADTVMGRARFSSSSGMQDAALRRAFMGGVTPGKSIDAGLSSGVKAVGAAAGGNFAAMDALFTDPAERAAIDKASLALKSNQMIKSAMIDSGEGGMDLGAISGVILKNSRGDNNAMQLFGGGRGMAAQALAAHGAGYDVAGARIAGGLGWNDGMSAKGNIENAQDKMHSSIRGGWIDGLISGSKDSSGRNDRWWDSIASAVGLPGDKVGRMQDDLMSSGGLDVVTALSAKGWDNTKMRDWEHENRNLSDDDRAEALGKELGVSGLTAEGLRSGRSFMNLTAGKNQKKTMADVAAAGGQMQTTGDFSNLVTAIGQTDVKSRKIGGDELSALSVAAQQASKGQGADVYGAMDKYLDALDGKDLSGLAASGPLGSAALNAVNMYGKVSKVRDIKGFNDLGISDEDLKTLGINTADGIDEGEATTVARSARRREFEGGLQTAGGIYTGSTEGTQLQLAAQMTALAGSTKALAETVGTVAAAQKANTSSTAASDGIAKPAPGAKEQ